VAVLVASTSTRIDGCPVWPFGLLALTTIAWDSVEVCGWLVWRIWVVRMVASMMVSWPPAGWDASSVECSFMGVLSGSQA
jgi:hypothetical protein